MNTMFSKSEPRKLHLPTAQTDHCPRARPEPGPVQRWAFWSLATLFVGCLLLVAWFWTLLLPTHAPGTGEAPVSPSGAEAADAGP